MQQNPPPPFPNPFNETRNPVAQSAAPQIPFDDPTSSSLFEWSDFLDFNLDESFNVPFSQPEREQLRIDTSQQPESSGRQKPGRVRKRDPRLVCSNFLAGRVPCACPELDKKLEEDESGLPGKKRTRMARLAGGGPTRCQVPGCEVDISELKGYHRRHRVCLRCATASAVVLDGENKRYCQQCGKFHILSDFDEDRRSCRRKLERHNTRRRKPNDVKGSLGKESQRTVLDDDLSGDDDTGKDVMCVSSQNEEQEILLESDELVSNQCSAPGSQNLQSDSFVSLAASGETQVEEDKQNPKFKHSPSYYDNKNSFSSVCPAGRISFKLYDWNPAEFPRRLRLQIFQWLASMPVELEGYIRPGCTILTAFIAMPKPLWHKLLEEPALHIKDLVASPGSLLCGRGTMHIFLNDMIFRVSEDATSVLKVEVKDQAPKLHYVYPNCFEAGKPMEFVACGSCLLQPNFRFLISFAGQYLAYDICVSSLFGKKGDTNNADHQLLKIYVPKIDMDLFGPAFIEVENQSGLSNFIPILVGDKETCAEMEVLQQKTNMPLSSQQQKCEVFSSRQSGTSELVLDIAWFLKKSISKQQLTSLNLRRLNHLFAFLIERESSVILERLLCSLKSSIDNNLVIGSSDSEKRLLQKNMDTAEKKLAQKLLKKETLLMPVVPASNLRMVKNMLGLITPSLSPSEDATVPLLNREVIMNVNLEERPKSPCTRSLTRTFFTSRPLIMAILAIGVCSGLCAVVLHPQKIEQIATTIHMCLSSTLPKR